MRDPVILRLVTGSGRAGTARLILCALVAVFMAATGAATADAKPHHHHHGHGKGKVPAQFFGVSAEHPDSEDFVGMGKAGFGTYRVVINWFQVQEKSPNEWNWTEPDKAILGALENGLRPVPVVFGTPNFVHDFTPQNLWPPVDAEDLGYWQQFMRALADRYGQGGEFFDLHPELDELPVRTWILWNEENVVFNWNPKPNPRQYAQLVKHADIGLTQGDPKAKVALGGMFGYPGGKDSIHAAPFLKRFYKVANIKKHFDEVNVHPYGRNLADVKKQITALRSVMKKAGDRKAGIFVGEIGWASSGPRRSDLVVGRKGQAKTIRKVMTFLLRKRRAWRIGGVLLYAWRDFPAGEIGCLWCPGAGLVKQDRSPKPSLRTVKKLIRSHVR